MTNALVHPEHLDSPISARFEVDEERRTITGLAVPYGATAMSNGQRFSFSKGTLAFGDVSRVKVLISHDFAKAVGVVTALDDTDEGLLMTARIAKGPAGDEALSMAAEGVWDGLSVGLGVGGRYRAQDGVNHAVAVPLREISLTPIPSFDDARVRAVAASQEGTPMETETTEVETQTVEQPEQFAAMTEALTGAISDGFANLANPQGGGREVVPAGRPTIEVNEPTPYRFDGIAGAHSLVEDLRDALFSNSNEARQRVDEFMGEAFAVATGNVGSLNPTQNRPDLFVPNLDFSRPLWESVSTGTVTDRTPFTVPKFSSATGLVAAHVEGVEPTPGAFTATSQSVTPTAMSGKVEINREVLDQGGSPQADAIIWSEMQRAYFEAIEQGIATMLNAVPTAELNLAGATDAALVAAMTNYYAGLQFVRGGNRYTGLVLDGMLFPALINAKDGQGRPLLPILGPTNANGQTTGGFDRVQIGNQSGRAAWALGATTASKSYSFVPSSVWAWASAPTRFSFEYQVKSVDLAIWGYRAAAVLRDSDVKPIDYTTAD